MLSFAPYKTFLIKKIVDDHEKHYHQLTSFCTWFSFILYMRQLCIIGRVFINRPCVHQSTSEVYNINVTVNQTRRMLQLSTHSTCILCLLFTTFIKLSAQCFHYCIPHSFIKCITLFLKNSKSHNILFHRLNRGC